MTEEEALTKQCCGAPCVADAVKYATGTLHGKGGKEPRWGMCIASACMAWRPNPSKTHHGRARDLTAPKGQQSWIGLSDVRRHEQHNAERPGEWEIERLPPEGHCGLAGQA